MRGDDDYRWTRDGERLGTVFDNFPLGKPQSNTRDCIAAIGTPFSEAGLGDWLARSCSDSYGAICESDPVSHMSFLK